MAKRTTKSPRRRQSARVRRSGPGAVAATAGNDILAWENDPFAQSRPTRPPAFATPIIRPIPNLQATGLGISIVEPGPVPARYHPGTADFRYWAAADALRRAADFWSGLVPNLGWHSTVGARLSVTLDAGEDLNAYYDRGGLDFFHGAVARTIVYSGESPDIVCHEFGHAVLDALRPQLWNAAAAEVAAFHESFGDMSALLCALQLPSVRERVLLDTQNRPYQNSQLSRLAEQLGWAIRQSHPDLVDDDCLRNAVNSFFYKDPTQLPPEAPASLLSSEPHSFSRIFTAAFLEAVAGIFAGLGAPTEQKLQTASADAARLLITAIQSAPVVPSYYSQIAAAMLRGATPTQQPALAGAFMRHGILAPEATHQARVTRSAARGGLAMTTRATTDSTRSATRTAGSDLPTTRLSFAGYGFTVESILVHSASEPTRLSVAGAAPSVGSLKPSTHAEAAKSFVEDLLRLGRLDLAAAGGPGRRVASLLQHPLRRRTHRLVRTGDGITLKRLHFDCGFACRCKRS
jgi:hypothetical protein